MSCMMGGNQAYDSFMQSPSYLGVVEAIPFVRSSLGSLSYEEELTVCFVKEPNSSEESALSLHLSRKLTNTNAAFIIINGLTISFVSDANDNIILMDCHLYLPKGAYLQNLNAVTLKNYYTIYDGEFVYGYFHQLQVTLCSKKCM